MQNFLFTLNFCSSIYVLENTKKAWNFSFKIRKNQKIRMNLSFKIRWFYLKFEVKIFLNIFLCMKSLFMRMNLSHRIINAKYSSAIEILSFPSSKGWLFFVKSWWLWFQTFIFSNRKRRRFKLIFLNFMIVKKKLISLSLIEIMP